ncbi:hypothetical protein Vadar_017672 [Vaccinium darrowii]|uniref:Uncharacterized protein n=1 Tax=Vaccinium darrowii TaxID=229202 RepID=A0ACB7ZCA2_9ERIC|nr:hypothetical protein Vadar_017672 [Vaccinium darrowii]
MAELVGGAFLSATLQVLFDRLASREFINSFRGRKHDERLLKKLKLKLLGLNKVLNDAEKKQITDQSVKAWLDELKDTIYHAEDLMDEIATEALRCKVEAEYQGCPNQVQSPISTSTRSFDAEVESKLEKMIDTLEDFDKEKDVLGLREIVGQKWSHRLEDGKAQGIFEKVRHFSYVQGEFDGFDKFEAIKEAKYLRTFLQIDCKPYRGKCLSKKVVDEILSGLTRLRLLSLSRNRITELPHSMGNLLHLRFLDLSHTAINCLPKSVCTLYNLETLLLSNCRLLTSLPAEIVKLVLLRHLDLSGTNLEEMPMQMSRLKDLQQLTAFVVGKCSGSGINELKELHHLRGTISISGLQNVTSGNAASEAKIREKKHLEKLALKWGSITDDSQNERDVLENLEPHTNLKHLEIKNYGGTRFPTWLGDQSFCNIASLHLENCEFCFSLPPLGQLRSLKELTISTMPGITNVGHGFYGENGSLRKSFESLETLRFERMSEWVDWCILDAGEFPRLQNLYIITCPKLIGDLPKEVPSLVRLEIKGCPKLVASLTRASSIRNLVLEECQGVQLEWQGVSSVETLHISNFASLKEFDSKLFTETNMEVLRIKNCPSLLSLPNVGFPPMFTSLSITSCKAMQCFPGEMMHLNNLIELSVEWCPALMLPLSEEMSHCYASLEYLSLCGCQSLKSLPLGLFPKLRYLRISCCINFETMLIPNGNEVHSLTLLEKLAITDCNNMISFPCGGLPAPKMTFLSVNSCKKLKALPEQMHILLPSLPGLYLTDCPEIESFPEGGLPSQLGYLTIRNCKKLVGGWRDWGLQAHPSLINFTLAGEYEEESLPKEGVLPSTLTSITLGSFPCLKSLNDMGIQLLGSLKYMQIRDCPQLQSLPEEGLPTSLIELIIWNCPLLKPRCRIEEGEDWHKIAHRKQESPLTQITKNWFHQAGKAQDELVPGSRA